MALAINKLRVEANLCKASFYDFFLRMWSDLVSEPLVANFHLGHLANELQVVAERVFRREPKEYDLIINVCPGSTKSTLASEMFPAWCWARDPTLRFIAGSYAFPLSLELASKCHRILTCEKYKALFPEVVLSKEAMGLIKTTKGGERFTTSTGGSVTGMHGHIIVIDDPINPKEAASEVTLKGANTWLTDTLASRMIDKQITVTILIMQRLHQDDPTGFLLRQRHDRPLRHICLPAEISDNVRPRALRRFYRDGLFDPKRLPREVLKRIQNAEMGQYAYAGQYMQTPIPAGGGMFQIDQIRIEAHPPLRFVREVRYWDKAGSAGKGAYTVGVKMGVDRDKAIWITDVVRGQWEAWQRERIIRQTAERDGRGVLIGVEQEPGSGGKESAQATVKNLMGFRVRVDRPVGDKALRADPFSAQVNGGNVRMLKAEWNGPYLGELQFFPFSKFKDQVDASSACFALIAGRRIAVGGLSAYASA